MKIIDTNYKIRFLDKEDDLFDIGECWGFCDTDKKNIAIAKNYKEVKRVYIHELVHAFLWEMGYETKCNDEEIVECITRVVIQLLKALKFWDKWKC